MIYDIDHLLATKADYELLEWLSSRLESGEELTEIETIPALVYQIDFAFRNGFSDLLWSYDVSLVYRGTGALEACGCDAALAATKDLRLILDRFKYQELMKQLESPLYEIDETIRESLLQEVAALEQKHGIISREFSRGLIEAAHKFVQANIADFRRIGEGEQGMGLKGLQP